MFSENLNYAREQLATARYTCVLCSNGKVLTDDRRGVKPLLDLWDNATDVTGFAAADKVVGKAAALLYCLMGIRCLYAGVISQGALAVLQQHSVEVEYGCLVPQIQNRRNDGICPLERAVWDIQDPGAALPIIKRTLAEQMKQP